jgi:hypothetical protein
VKFLPYGRARALLLAPALVAATIVGVVTHGSDLAGAAAAGGAWPIETHGAPRATDNVVLKWDEQLLSTIRAYPAQTGPTVTARALAVLHTATYDAWAAYDPTAVGTRPDGPAQQPGGTAADRSKAISVAAYRVLVDLFPPANFPSTATYSTPDVLMRSLQYDPADGSAPAAVGNQAAAAVLDFRHADGSNQLNGYADTTGYQSKNTWDEATDPWSWQPLCVLTAAGVSAKAPPFPADGACAAPNYAV